MTACSRETIEEKTPRWASRWLALAASIVSVVFVSGVRAQESTPGGAAATGAPGEPGGVPASLEDDRHEAVAAAAAAIMGVVDKASEGRGATEKPRIVPAIRKEESLATWRFELPVPLVKQVGNKTNCGPSAAAMAVVAFRGAEASAPLVRELRDTIGEWTWQAFPMRQMRLPGYDAGMTTRHMMKASMERFEPTVGWAPVEHAWLPLEVWSIVTLKKALAERRPMVVLAEARTLWGLDAAGLHWVVVTGLDGGSVVFNDPADGTPAKVSLERFWTAWRLSAIYRSLPMVAGFEALVADRSLPVIHAPMPDLRPAPIPPVF